jgi:hypothetical protein
MLPFDACLKIYEILGYLPVESKASGAESQPFAKAAKDGAPKENLTTDEH